MSFGRFVTSQRDVVQRHVRDAAVCDLGAGNLELSRELLDLGAASVHAIDKRDQPEIDPWPDRLRYTKTYFNTVRGPFDVLFLSWPANVLDPEVLRLIQTARKVVYLGKCTDGSMCGHPALFGLLIRRRLLDYVPDRANCLIVVGESLPKPRAPTGEELAGLLVDSIMYSFDQAERAAGVQ